MHHPTDRITHTTAFVTPVVEHWLEREIAQWVHPLSCAVWEWQSSSGRYWGGSTPDLQEVNVTTTVFGAYM